MNTDSTKSPFVLAQQIDCKQHGDEFLAILRLTRISFRHESTVNCKTHLSAVAKSGSLPLLCPTHWQGLRWVHWHDQ
eukprot:3657136-Amphidinium_carterae.1